MSQFRVRMMSYEKPQVRLVSVPDDELTGESAHDLERIFYYGQNDFQPQKVYSVSVGDVVEYMGELHVVCAMGFRRITDAEYEEALATDLDKRRLLFYI